MHVEEEERILLLLFHGTKKHLLPLLLARHYYHHCFHCYCRPSPHSKERERETAVLRVEAVMKNDEAAKKKR